MTAKPKKKSNNNSDMKATAVIIFVILFGIAGFFLWQRFSKPSPQVKKPKAVTTVPKKTTPIPKPGEPLVKPPIKGVPQQPVAVEPKRPLIQKGNGAKIAFVLDDWGYSTQNCAILTEIKQPLAIAILPSLRHTDDVLDCAGKARKDLMLHLPMQPYLNRDPYPSNYLLTTTMSPNKVEAILENILKRMPQIIGVNNHMGSKAMEDKRLLKLVFRHLKQHNLFFVDSMTSPNHSMGNETAKEIGLQFGQRDVFLDNINTREAILKQFDELMAKAIKKGSAVAIGHDRALTMKIIKEQAPLLEKQGFKIVSIKELLRNK